MKLDPLSIGSRSNSSLLASSWSSDRKISRLISGRSRYLAATLPILLGASPFLLSPAAKADTATNLLINGGFEIQNPALNPLPPNYFNTSPGQVTGWQTTDPDGMIEAWSNGFTPPKPGYAFYTIAPQQSASIPDLFFPNGGGAFMVEANGKAPDAISQVVSLPKTGLLSYSFWTQGRFGVDTLRLDIQKNVNGQWQTVQTRLVKTGSNPNGNGWVNYQEKNVFLGQQGEVYRYSLTAVETANGNPATGNLIDNLAFGYIVSDNPEPSVPPLQPNPGGGDLSPSDVQNQLGQTIGVAMTQPEITSAFLPRNTDVAPAGIQRYYGVLGANVLGLDDWPQQLPLCDALRLNPRGFGVNTGTMTSDPAPECSCENYKTSRNQFTFAQDPRDYYGYRTGLRAWVKGFSSSLTNISNPDLGNWNNRGDVRGGGGLVGLESSITSTTQVGVYGNAGGLSVIQSGNGGANWSPSAYGAGLYGRWSPGPYFLMAQAGYGWLGGDQNRTINLNSQTLQASGYKTADVFNTAVSAGARLRWGTDTLITPSVMFGWANVNENGFNESGAGVFNSGDLFNLNYNGYASSWSNLDLGVTLSQAIRSGTTLIIPSFRVSYFGDWKTGGGDPTVNYSFSPETVAVPGGWLDRNGVRLALGVNVTTNRNTSLFVRGTADLSGDGFGGTIADYGINGGVLFRFGGAPSRQRVADTCPVPAAVPVPEPVPAPAPAPVEPVRGLW